MNGLFLTLQSKKQMCLCVTCVLQLKTQGLPLRRHQNPSVVDEQMWATSTRSQKQWESAQWLPVFRTPTAGEYRDVGTQGKPTTLITTPATPGGQQLLTSVPKPACVPETTLDTKGKGKTALELAPRGSEAQVTSAYSPISTARL